MEVGGEYLVSFLCCGVMFSFLFKHFIGKPYYLIPLLINGSNGRLTADSEVHTCSVTTYLDSLGVAWEKHCALFSPLHWGLNLAAQSSVWFKAMKWIQNSWKGSKGKGKLCNTSESGVFTHPLWRRVQPSHPKCTRSTLHSDRIAGAVGHLRVWFITSCGRCSVSTQRQNFIWSDFVHEPSLVFSADSVGVLLHKVHVNICLWSKF